MNQAQIIPQYINQPKQANWTNGSVKDTNGQLWAVDKAALGMFAQGTAVNITYDPPFGNRKYPTITAINGQQVAPSQTAGFTPAGQAAQPPQQPQGGWQPQTAQNAPAAAPGSSAPMPDTLLSNVLATAVEKGAIQSPNELGMWANAIAQAHRIYHGLEQIQMDKSGYAQDGPPAGHPATQDLDPQDTVPF